MADPAPATPVSNTTIAAGSTGAALIFAQWLVHPVWPPPEPVLTIAITALVPIGHLLARAIYNRLVKVASDIDPSDDPKPAPPQAAPATPLPPAA